MVFMTAGAAGQSETGMVEPPSTTMLAQADTSGVPAFEGDDDEGDEGDEEEVPIPPNLQDKETLPDTAAVAPDTLRNALPVSPGLPDTLHMPGSQPRGPGGRAAGSTLPTTPAKSKGSLFGLAPVFVIGAIVVVNVLIIRAVGGD